MTSQELALRIALSALLKEYARVADIFCFRPETHKPYNDAKELLSAPKEANA